jgi:hypothetical protein
MKKLILAFSLIALTTTVFAQREQTLLNGRGLRLTGAWGGTQLGAASINDELSALRTGFGGIELNKNWFLGYLAAETEDNVRFDELNNDNYKLSYHGLVLGYQPASFRTVHPNISVVAARGRNRYVAGGLDNDRIYVVQPQLGLEMNITRWFRLGLDGGYRFMLDSDLPGLTDEMLSGAYGQLSMKFGWSWGSRSNNTSRSNER